MTAAQSKALLRSAPRGRPREQPDNP